MTPRCANATDATAAEQQGALHYADATSALPQIGEGGPMIKPDCRIFWRTHWGWGGGGGGGGGGEIAAGVPGRATISELRATV